MGRKHIPITGFYDKLIPSTTFEVIGNHNIVINSIDTKERPINYVVPINTFKIYADKCIELISMEGHIHINEIIEVLFKEIYQSFKTKVSTTRIPLIILNILVKEDLLYTDDGENYKLCQDVLKYKEFICKIYSK